jgi:hypothetical protein
MKENMAKEHLVINKIEEVCDADIENYYRVIVIRQIIKDWRDGD